MDRYILEEIYRVDGYERTAAIREVETGNKRTVCFLQYDEYLEDNEESKKKKAGDSLRGDVFIEYVISGKKVDGQLMHRQGRDKSPSIEAIVDVAEVKDRYSVYAFSTIIRDNILIEFETPMNYKKGDRIYIEGELKFEEFDEGAC